MNPTDTAAPPASVDPDPPDSVVASPGAPDTPDAVATTPATSDPEPPESVVADPGNGNVPAAAAPPQPVTITVLEGMKVLFDEKVGLAPVQVIEKMKPENKQHTDASNGSIH